MTEHEAAASSLRGEGSRRDDPAAAATARRQRRASASSPTRPSASAARHARSPVRSGTWSPRTASPGPGSRTTTPARSAPTPGATSPSSSSRSRSGSTTSRPTLAGDALRWLMSSDVCKHCTHAACLDVCPTGVALPHRVRHGRRAGGHLQRLRLLHPRLPFGVIDRRTSPRPRPARPRRGRTGVEVHPLLRPAEGRARAGVREGLSHPVDPVRPARRAARTSRRPPREARRATAGTGHGSTATTPDDGVGGFGAFFLLLDEPEVYGLPPDPVVTTRDLPQMWRTAAFAAGALLPPSRRRRVGSRRASRLASGASTATPLLLRPADPQGARLEAADPLLFLHRRPGRRLRGAEPRRASAGRAASRADRLAVAPARASSSARPC